MADDWRNQPDSFDTLRVPFVFVPEGASAPADWLTDHPSHIRVPATFVPSRRSRELPEHRRDQSSPPVAPSGDGGTTGVSGTFAPVGVRGRRRWPPPPEIDRSGYLRETPVAAFLRANETFVRLGVVGHDTRDGEASGAVPLPTTVNDGPIQPVYPLEYAIGIASGGGVLRTLGSAIIRQFLPSPQRPHAPNFVASPNGTVYPVPEGAQGPTPIINNAGDQTGVAFTGGSGGANGQVSTMRLMNPTPPRGNSPGYPNGYIVYQNNASPTPQLVDPITGQTTSRASGHIPVK